MKLKGVFDNQEGYDVILNNLRSKYGTGKWNSLNIKDFCDGDYTVQNRYATKVYRGKLKEDVEVTALELAIICDDGYSFFGGSSNIGRDKSFVVEIWID